MSIAVTIRAEQPGDEPLITSLVQRAYTDVPYSNHREHRMIERLRETPAFLPDLSLVAEADGEAVGHVLLTAAAIDNGTQTWPTLALAPLSVVPDRQSYGIGAQLVRAAHERAATLCFDSVVLLGLPGYYPRFGYEPLARYPIVLPFEVPSSNAMILALRPGALTGVSGIVRHAAGWLDH